MKVLIILIANLTLIFSNCEKRNSINIDKRVDSLFSSNFSKIKSSIQNNERFTKEESRFIYLLGFLSGINYDIESYSGTPKITIEKLSEFRNWYKKNKSKIKWEQVEKGLKILRSPPTEDEQIDELEKLKIE